MKKFLVWSALLFTSLTFLFFVLGHLGRLSFLGQQVNGYLYEVTAFIAVFTMVFSMGMKPVRNQVGKYKAAFVFLGFLFIAYFLDIGGYSIESNIVAFLYFIRLSFYFAFFFVLSAFLSESKKRTQIFFYMFSGLAVLIGVVSFIQYIFYPELRNLIYLGWDPHLYRMFGTFFDTSIAGAVYSLCFYFFYLYGQIFLKNRYVVYVCMTVFFLCIVFTLSRTTYLAFLLSFVYLLIRNKRYLLTGGLLISFLALLILVPKPFGEGVNLMRTVSIESRIQDYSDGFRIGSKKILFGYGYNRLRPVKKEFGLIGEKNYEVTHAGASFHSSFLILLVTSGVVGLALFLWVLWEFGKRGKYAFIIVGYLSLLSLGDNIILHPFILFLMMGILAFDYAVSHLYRTSR